MKTMLKKIVFWTISGITIAEFVPVAIISTIITNIKDESAEQHCRRCYRMMPWYFRMVGCSEDDFIYNYCMNRD